MLVSARDKKEPSISSSQENTSFYEKPMKELHALSTLKRLSDFEEGFSDVTGRGTADLSKNYSNNCNFGINNCLIFQEIHSVISRGGMV